VDHLSDVDFLQRRDSFREKVVELVRVCLVCLCILVMLLLLLLLLCSLNQLLLCSFVLSPSLSLGTLSSIIENYIIIMYSTRFFPVLFGSSVVLISGIFTVITRRLYFSYANFYDYSR